MRRITILAVPAPAAVTTALAQPGVPKKKAPKPELVKHPERVKLADIDFSAAKAQKPGQMTFAKVKQNQAKNAKDSKVMRARKGKVNRNRMAESGIIIDQPAGTLHQMVYSTNSYAYNWLFGYYVTSYSDRIGEVVEGTDGNIYIHNLLTDATNDPGYWVKAEKAQGDTIVIHQQPIWEEEYEGEIYTYDIQRIDFVNGETVMPKNNDIKMIWKDNKLTTVDDFNTPVDDMRCIITAFDNEGYWIGAANWNISMEKQTDVAITELPAGAEPMDMVMKYKDADEKLSATKVKLAFSGNDAYLQYYEDLGSWIKGTVNGDKVTFSTRQYLGADTYYSSHVYFMAVSSDDYYFENVVDEVTFDYDAANCILSNTANWIFVNGGKSQIYYIDAYQNPYIFKFVEKPASPMTPEITEVINFNPVAGYGYISIDAPFFDAEENYLDPDKMYYKVFIDDKEFVFDPYEYPELDVPTTDIPYNLSDITIYADGSTHEVEIFFNIQKNVGVQMFYTGGGEVHSSDIAWYEVDGGEFTGKEGFMPLVEDGQPNSNLNEGEVAINLGAVSYGFSSGAIDDETYDVCYHIDDPTLVGAQVTAINVPFLDVTGVSNAKVWLSKQLGLQDGKFQADIVTKDFETARGFNQVVLDQPYTIPEGGIYVGYSFVKTLDSQESKKSTPVMLTNYTTDGGFLVHTTWAFRQGWTSLYGKWGDLALETVVKGGKIEANNAIIGEVNEFYAKTGEPSKANIYVTNYGYQGVNSFDYAYSINGQATETKHIDLNPGMGRVYGSYHNIDIDMPAMAQKGSYPVTMKVTKVNGNDNPLAYNEAKTIMHVLNIMPKKRPLLEEYTGTWCGYCPRGFVALEKMNKLYPDDFIALSYHNADPMEFTYEFPNEIEGFPDAWIDRYYQTDAYCGDKSEKVWGFEEVWLNLSKEFGTADINVTAEWDETQQYVNVTTVANFPIAKDNCNYGLAYALVADGLRGNTSDWAQSNYYSGDFTWPKDMREFVMGGDDVSGLTYNDVLCGLSSFDGLEGSLPANIAEDGVYGHNYQFDTTQAVNTNGDPIIQNKNKVRVVAMLIDNTTGVVLNASKCNVVPFGTGIANTIDNGQVESVSYYDLSGRKVLLPNGGVYIKSVNYKNGKTVNQKVLVK